MRWSVAALLVLMSVTPAAAQSTYVGGSLLFELARFGGVDVDEGSLAAVTSSSLLEVDQNGDSLGFDVRVGRAIGERWGVELAYARGGEIEDRFSRFLSTRSPELPLPVPTLPTVGFEYEITTTQQHSTFDALAWVRQELGDRVDLAVSGGVSFARVASEQRLRFTDTRLAQLIALPGEIETVRYDVGPVVGAEAIIDAGEHLAFTAGVRLHGLTTNGLGGWLIRPSMGLRWTF